MKLTILHKQKVNIEKWIGYFFIYKFQRVILEKKSEDAMSNDCSSDTKGIDYVAEDVI